MGHGQAIDSDGKKENEKQLASIPDPGTKKRLH
jgi:hypothetical protein